MSNILDQLKREGSMALWHAYRLGHANDLSGNGNHGTLVNAPKWSRNGLDFEHLGNQAVQVTQSASINLQTLTAAFFIVTKRICQVSSGLSTPMVKWDGGTLEWGFRSAGRAAFSVDYNGGATTASFPNGVDGRSLISISLNNGSTATISCADGVLEDAAFSTAPNVPVETNDFFIGNGHALARGYGRTISDAFIFNKVLSETENAQLYGQLMKTRLGVIV